MNERLICTLVADGTSDKMLLQPITWLLYHHLPGWEIEVNFIDPNRLPHKGSLADRLRSAVLVNPCDLLFIHRDAEGHSYEERQKEIEEAYAASGLDVPYVEVIPVRMTEAWLLHDEAALRLAADNPNGKIVLALPSTKVVHQVNDPKKELETLLITASELNQRRLKRFKPRQRMHRLAELIDDFSVLRVQDSFFRLEQRIIDWKKQREDPFQ